MRYRLYYYPGNANFAPHLLLAEAHCDVELVLVDRQAHAQGTADYLRLNPNGRIPTLVVGDLILFEAAAICLHVADHHPEAGLAPPLGSASRSHFYKWLVFLTNTVQPAYMAYRYPEQHTTQPSEAAGVKAAAAQRVLAAFRVLETSLGPGPFVLGSDYSACDAYLLMLAWWARRLLHPLEDWPRLSECVEAVLARPATRQVCRAEGVEVRF
jgi:glutathione S-transferase